MEGRFPNALALSEITDFLDGKVRKKNNNFEKTVITVTYILVKIARYSFLFLPNCEKRLGFIFKFDWIGEGTFNSAPQFTL